MKNINKYYENTKKSLPHENVKEFIELSIRPGKAIDLGCGAGRDTVFLIKNNWDVVSVDKENTSQFIIEKLSKQELNKFEFIQSDFENMVLPKNNLLVANYSIPFCDKEKFKDVWNKIVLSIELNRILCWKFFWRK